MTDVKLNVNGSEVPLSEFPEQFIENTILGMIKSLKGVDEIKTVDISITL